VLKTLRGASSFILSLAAFNVGSRLYVASGCNKEINIWSVSDDSLLRVLGGHADWVTSLVVLNEKVNGMPILASGSNDATIKLWNSNNGKLIKTLSGHINYVLSLAVSSISNTLFSGSADSTIKTWNITSGELVNTISGGYYYGVMSLALLEREATLAGGSYRDIKIWKIKQEMK